jgi:hypothetical protein
MKKCERGDKMLVGGIVSASALALILGMGSVSAAEQGSDQGMEHGQTMSFSQLDTNGDGKISKDEAQAAMAPGEDASQLDSNFAQADKNADGELDQSEFSAFESMQQPSGEQQNGSE